jgi:hypothetical protein
MTDKPGDKGTRAHKDVDTEQDEHKRREFMHAMLADLRALDRRTEAVELRSSILYGTEIRAVAVTRMDSSCDARTADVPSGAISTSRVENGAWIQHESGVLIRVQRE